MKVLFFRVILWLVFNLRISMTWSKIYRFLYERKFKDVKLTKYANFTELSKFVGSQTWVADKFKQLWDATSTPQKVQWVADNTPKHEIGDCDEFAIYSVNVVEDGLSDGTFNDPNLHVQDAYMLTVCWVNQDNKLMGHNVCLLDTGEDLKWRYMDYHMPSVAKATIGEIALLVAASFSGLGTKSLGWVQVTKDLKFVKYGI